MKLILVELDERARQYIIKKIEDTMELSRTVIARLDPGRGSVYSIWPDDIGQDGIYSFDTGGVMPGMHSREWLVASIQQHLFSKPQNVVIFENPTADRAHPYIARLKSNMVFRNQEVYHFLLSEDIDTETVFMHVREAMRSWRNWVLFSSLDGDSTLWRGGELDSNTIDMLVKNADKFILDAYDYDSYLIWQL
jgi:hypothetical protein